jgi:cell division protein FtsI (penicillin-binding protein 3)
MATFIGLGAWLGLRLYQLQIVQSEHLAVMGNRQTDRVWPLPAPRGSLLDANGMPLVESQGSWTITCDPRYMDNRLGATVALSEILNLPRDTLRAQFESNRNGRLLAKNVDDATAEKIKALVHSKDEAKRLTGVYVRREFTRLYRERDLAAHVLGFTQADGKGAAGVELQFNNLLGGTPGKEILQIDNKGNPVLSGLESIPAKPGANVQLTLDVVIQRELEKALLAAVEKHSPLRAAGIVMRPATGEILAMASWPSFDPSTRAGVSGEAQRNNVTQLNYEPGSTFKPLIAGAAVHEKLTSFNDTIFCERGKWIYREGKASRTVTDHSLKTGGHGNLTVTDGIAKSDNILMAKLGVRLGVEKTYSWLTNLGFGKKTGISLPGEAVGSIPARKRWSVMWECISTSFGHGVMVTPMQLIAAHAAIANGGMWNPPRLVRRIYTVDEGKQSDLPLPALEPPRRMYSAVDAAAIQEAMTHTMDDGGTGAALELDGYVSAGKTGTAEKVIDGHYSKDGRAVGSFVCWAPADAAHKPELIALVVIDDSTKNGHYGGTTAGPTVQKVLQASLEYLKIPKDPALMKTPPAEPNAVATSDPPKRKRSGR